MTTELAIITPIKNPSFSTLKGHFYYAKDDSCITTPSSHYIETHEFEEFSSLFKKSRKHGQTLAIDVSLELEVMRNSLGKIAMQRRMDRRYSQDSTFSTVSHNSAISNISEEDDSCPLSPKVHNLLWDLENCLARIQQTDDGNGTDTLSTASQSYLLEGNADPASSMSTRLFSKSVSTAVVSTPLSIVPVNSFSNKGSHRSEISNDKNTLGSSDYSSLLNLSPKSITSKHNVTVSEVYIIAVLAGWILKLSSSSFFSLKNWKRRFLVLTPTTLFRYKSSAPAAVADEYLELTPETIACVTDKFAGKRWVLEITTPLKPSWYIQTESLDELKTWLNALKASVIRAKYSSNRLPSPNGFSIPSIKEDNGSGFVSSDNSRRDSTATIPFTRPRTLHTLSSNSKSMSALPPQPPIPRYLPPLPPTSDGSAESQRQRISRVYSSPAVIGTSMAKASRMNSMSRRLQVNHIDAPLPSSRRNSAVLPTLNEDE